MYDDLINKGQLYGRGFTLFGKINSNEYTPLSGDLTELIKNKFFDKLTTQIGYYQTLSRLTTMSSKEKSFALLVRYYKNF